METTSKDRINLPEVFSFCTAGHELESQQLARSFDGSPPLDASSRSERHDKASRTHHK